MNAMVFREACQHFAEVAAPYLPIRDAAHYEEVLRLIENLLEDAEDSANDPLNIVIDMLSRAVEQYERRTPSWPPLRQTARHNLLISPCCAY